MKNELLDDSWIDTYQHHVPCADLSETLEYAKEHGNSNNHATHGFAGCLHTDESKKRISDSKLGENHHYYGKTLSEDHKQKISKGCTGRVDTDDTRQKKSIAQRGKTHSEETRRKISESKTGKTGHKHSEETRKKMSIAASGKFRPTIKCPHCDKEGDSANMKRWHFDNCKHREVDENG